MKHSILYFLCFSFLFFFTCIFFSACHFLPGQKSSSSQNTSEPAAGTDKTGDEAGEGTVNSSKEGSGAPDSSGADSSDNHSQGQASTEYVDPSTLPNTMASWWFKRNEEHRTPEVQNEIDLTKYDAWYAKLNLKEGEKPVFLTFDCGYENGYTPGILDVLKKHKAAAAFFVCKHFIEDQPELIKRMKEEGHVVGNHTANHICMPESDERTIREEIANNANYMKEATGYEMDPFFRPPKGEYSERTLQITREMGYTTVFWSLAYPDYDVNNQPGADYVIERFEKYIHPGAIPLIHNISESNAQALDTVLTNLEKEGYTFRSLYDLSSTGDA